MPAGLKTSARTTMAVVAAFAAGLLVVPTAFAKDAMPAAQQNALVQRYCAVCHTDAARNGGLSLEQFDAAQAEPSLAAMMLSKLTSGVALETVKAAAFDPNAAALLAKKIESGAMGAAGLPVPDKATIDALISALASEATGAEEWNMKRIRDRATKAPMLMASILRELPSTQNAGEAAMYRLVLACNESTHEGEIQLAWSPVPRTGTLLAAVDGKTPLRYKVEGTERMGNGSQVTAGPAALSLYESKKDSQAPRMPLPAKALRITNLFPNESVDFSFDDLPQTARRSLAVCFKEGDTGK